MSRNVASDETLDAWIALPPDDLRTIEEFAEQSSDGPAARPAVVGRIVTTRIITNPVQLPEPPSVRLLRAIAHHKPLGRPERIRVSPEVGEEIEVELREDIRVGGHAMPTEPGEWAFRGVPVKVDHTLTGSTIQTD